MLYHEQLNLNVSFASKRCLPPYWFVCCWMLFNSVSLQRTLQTQCCSSCLKCVTEISKSTKFSALVHGQIFERCLTNPSPRSSSSGRRARSMASCWTACCCTMQTPRFWWLWAGDHLPAAALLSSSAATFNAL